MKTLSLLSLLLVGACIETAPPGTQPPAADRPMDEVPEQTVRPDGAREYRFNNGCVIVLAAEQAVLRSETGSCALYQRDIALLYASDD